MTLVSSAGMRSDQHVLLLAGNGFVGQATCRRLATGGRRVTVYHTGRRPIPALSGLDEIIAEPGPLPIVAFPPEVVTAAEGAVAVHFQCMGSRDGGAFADAFADVASRLVLISSSDVYRAYGCFIRTEDGPLEPTPVAEDAPLRRTPYPYRRPGADPDTLPSWYDKIHAERAVRAAARSETTILRLPKVYGPGGNADLATVYGFAAQPGWRWTHGYVDNVAAAIALARVASASR